MTVPVIPGPFNFLNRFGQALESVGAEVTARKERGRRRFLEDQALAQQDAEFILQMVAQTGNPEMLNSPRVQDTLKRAGIDTGMLSVILPETAQRAGAIPQLPQARREAALGLPSAGAVETAEAELGPRRLRANITADVLRTVPQGSAQARAVAEVPSVPVAAAAEGTQEAQLTAQRGQAEVVSKLSGQIKTKLDDPTTDFGKWSAIAQMGFLPLYLARIHSNASYLANTRQQDRQLAALLATPIENAHRAYREQLNRHQQERADHQGILELNLRSEEQVKEALAEWDTRNPVPSLGEVQTQSVVSFATDYFNEPDPKIATRLYFEELRKVHGATSSVVSSTRMSALRSAASAVAAGSLEQAAAEQTISETAADATIELIEFRRLVQELQTKKQEP